MHFKKKITRKHTLHVDAAVQKATFILYLERKSNLAVLVSPLKTTLCKVHFTKEFRNTRNTTIIFSLRKSSINIT